MDFKKHTWSHVDLNASCGHDPLLACLVLLTRYYQNPYSAQSLVGRLPLDNNRFTVDVFERAAERANLKSDVMQTTLDDVTDDQLPLIVLLEDGGARLYVMDESKQRKILDPLTGTFDAPSSIEGDYIGQVIQIEPDFTHTARAKESLDKPPKDWFWQILLKSWPIYAEVLLASFLINLFALAIPLFTMNVYDRVVPNNAIETMWVLAGGVAIVFLFDMLLKTLRSHFIDIASKKSDIALSARIFEQILGLDMTKRPKSVGVLTNTVQSFESFRDFITSSTMTVLVDLPFVIIYIFVIYLIGGPLAWVPIAIIPIIFAIGFLLQLPLIKLTKQSYQYSAEKQATLYESLANIETVKTTTAESSLQSRWEQIIKRAAENGMKLRFTANLSMNLSAFAQQSSSIFTVIIGVYLIANGEMTTGALIACTILVGRALAPMSQVASLFTRYYQSVNALQSVNKIMQLPTDNQEDMHFLNRPPLKGQLEFQHVVFDYNDEKMPILKDLSFKINPGEKVGIIGKVGSGKSTLARIILKLYLPGQGTVLLDGTDYRQINPDDLRQQIGYVPQDISLFYGSVRQNITVGAPFIDDARLIRAANIAGIGGFTNNHPSGLDRQVGERGSELSGGQRQAVAIARAILRDPKLLIMDEPTSAMDDNSERFIKKQLTDYLTKEHTLLLITHKMSMLEMIDRIILIDEGKIIADGPKESVLAALRAGFNTEKTKEIV